MTTFETKLSRISYLIGKKITKDELEKLLSDIGMELASINKEKITIELTAERPDLLSPVGISRALKSFLGLEKGMPKYTVKESNYKIKVDRSVEKIRPFTVAVVVKNLKMTDDNLKEIIYVQEKLHQTYGRDRKNFAIGIYPMENIEFPITFKADSPDKIKFRPLGSNSEITADKILKQNPTGKKYANLLDGLNKYPYFIDAKGDILSMPPIINSEKTGRVTENTTSVFIEVSGHDLLTIEKYLNILSAMFSDFSGELFSVKIEYPYEEYLKNAFQNDLKNKSNIIETPQLEPGKITIDIKNINSLIGLKLNSSEIKKLLEKMMYSVVETKGDRITFNYPKIRTDIWHEVDVADDVARSYGFENIKETLPSISTIAKTMPISDFKEKVSELLKGYGFIEAYNFALTSKEEQFDMMQQKQEESIALEKSADKAYNMVRKWLLPEMLKALRSNKDCAFPQKVYESGFVVIPNKEKDTLSENLLKLCVLVTDDNINFNSAKLILNSLANDLGLEYKIAANKKPYFIKGRSGTILSDEKEIGIIGEVHPKVLTNWNLTRPIAAFEIDLEKLFSVLK